VYEYCDLKWGSITASGFIAFIIGVATFLFPRHAIGFIVIFSAIVILILAGILIAEGLFIEGGGISRWLIAGIGVVGVLLALLSLVYPILIVDTAGILIRGSLVIFGCMMVFAAATIIFDFFVRSIVAFSSFLAILLVVYLILTGEQPDDLQPGDRDISHPVWHCPDRVWYSPAELAEDLPCLLSQKERMTGPGARKILFFLFRGHVLQ
jgi:hypothetical protein